MHPYFKHHEGGDKYKNWKHPCKWEKKREKRKEEKKGKRERKKSQCHVLLDVRPARAQSARSAPWPRICDSGPSTNNFLASRYRKKEKKSKVVEWKLSTGTIMIRIVINRAQENPKTHFRIEGSLRFWSKFTYRFYVRFVDKLFLYFKIVNLEVGGIFPQTPKSMIFLKIH